MRLQRVLGIAAIIGFFVPIASFLVWRLGYATGFGKVLDDWNSRVQLFPSLESEIFTHSHAFFDYEFWDVLWVAGINVPLYMAFGMFWWAFYKRGRKA